MIVIDIPADLHVEDDTGRNFAQVPPGRDFTPGDVAVAGHPDAWSWVLVDEVDTRFVTFHQVTTEEAQRARVQAALAGDLPLRALSTQESAAFDAEISARIAGRLAEADFVDEVAGERVSSLSLDSEGNVVVYRPDGTTSPGPTAPA